MRHRSTWLIGLALVAMLAGFAAILASPAEAIVLHGFFEDDDGSVFEGDIDSIALAGITKGCNPPANTNYCPDLAVDRGAMAAFLDRALNLPPSNTDHFIDDNNSIFEASINSLADAGITKGCNPPTNNRYCPNSPVDRGAMAAFLDRALNLPPSNTDHFIDDNNSIFEASINSLADAGITKGCNPPTNNRYCPNSPVDRGAMAAFLRRALNLPAYVIQIPMSDDSVVTCEKDGERCDVVVDLQANRNYSVEEGVFNVLPYGPGEEAAFTGGSTSFTLVMNGSNVTLTELPLDNSGDDVTRSWTTNVNFGAGQHQLVGRWRIDGQLILTTFVTINAD